MRMISTLRCHYQRVMIGFHFCRSMDRFLDRVGTCACILHQICATSCTLLDCCIASAGLGSYSGTVGMSSYEILALDPAPIAGLASWWRSTHRSLSWFCPRIWWSPLCGVVEWTKLRGRTIRMALWKPSKSVFIKRSAWFANKFRDC